MVFKIISITLTLIIVIQFWKLSLNHLCFKKKINAYFELGTKTVHKKAFFRNRFYKCRNHRIFKTENGSLFKYEDHLLKLKLKKLNNKGFSIFGVLLVNTLISLLILQFYQFKLSEDKIIDRSRIYLCFGKTVLLSQKYIKKMIIFNRAIKVNHKLSFMPQFKLQATVIKKALQSTQNIMHILFLKNIGTQEKCSLANKFKIIKNPPFLSSLTKLKRDFQGAARIRASRWEYRLRSQRGITLKAIFNINKPDDFKTEEVPTGSSYLSYLL
ncbi:MAG: hypothetical protein ACO20H_04615 [Bacteriovoracaceae bacterium]